MNERLTKLKDRLKVDKYPICLEKASLILDSYKQTEGLPTVLRRAMSTAHYLDHKSIFIEDGELLVGNVASLPMGMEAGSLGPTWPEEDLDDLKKGSLYISPEDETRLRAMDSYWLGQGRTLDERQGLYYDDDHLWPFIKSGILCPPWNRKEQGRGPGTAGVGWGLGIGLSLILPDYAKVINEGLNKVIGDARAELTNLRYTDTEAIKKADFLKATVIAFEAIVRIGKRFGDLASGMAREEKDSVRKNELQRIAETCYRVPGEPAGTFREAMQSFWFYWMMVASGTTPGGRFDQFMYPFYKKDREMGRINDHEVLELLECLRIKIMHFNFINGGKEQRDKWAGIARWHNFVIGGVTPDGADATNELSYLILEAALDCQTPHHTITVRVHDKTPEELMIKALEVVRTGIGMPAFISDNSYLDFLTSQGVSMVEARDYALAGCLDVNLPGKSRINAFGMFVVPRIFEITMNNGVEPKTGVQLGPKTGEFASFETFDDFMKAFKEQLCFFMSLTNEEHNILLQAQRDLYPDVVHSALMVDAIKVGKDALDRALPFENGSALNMVGMINVADSMAVVKKLVFEERKVSKKDLHAALAANWEGYEDIRRMCLAVPKFGNGDAFVDSIACELYRFWADTSNSFRSIYGATVKPTAISITAHAPGGSMTGATPDGRYAGDSLPDGSMSPSQGMDLNGPTGVIRSAVAVDQSSYQATLLNMKFHPTALQSTDDLRKLSGLIKTYFKNGGKHIQFNVVDQETLLKAQKNPERYRDLIVRVAGYSTYFTILNKAVQDEIIERAEHRSTV
ncbi:MAG: pyruvate formate lyase family protein [Bacillota bacterium]|nr:pyruvate formate lyase family protein [Bacillota bacterium]